MSNIQPKQTGWTTARGVRAGFVLGALISCGELLLEFARRLSWALGGGGGESALWGEPLFYMIVLGLPAGLIGALAGALLVAVVRWILQLR